MFREEQIGDARLILGDCREWFASVPPCFRVDAVVTDPPYGIGAQYESFDDTPENVARLAADWLPLARATAKRVCFTSGIKNQHVYPQPDWICAQIIPAGGHNSPWGFGMWQPILCYGKDAYLAKGLGSRPDTIITNYVTDKNQHPCPKTEKTMLRFIERFSLPGEIVCDPFMGSGTTGVACLKLGRRFIGIEIEPKYFDIACRRIEAAYRQPDMFIQSAPEPKPMQPALFDGEAA